MNKKDLTEADIRTKFITPAIKRAGWYLDTRLREEVRFPEPAALVERVESLMTTCRDLKAEIERSRTHAADPLQAVRKEAFVS